MNQLEFYEKHNFYINAYFRGERVEIRYSDKDVWGVVLHQYTESFLVRGFKFPEKVQFRIAKKEHPDLMGKRLHHPDGREWIVGSKSARGSYHRFEGWLTPEQIFDDGWEIAE